MASLPAAAIMSEPAALACCTASSMAELGCPPRLRLITCALDGALTPLRDPSSAVKPAAYRIPWAIP